MLPGFRFLFAAVVLCLSMLVFGFGATALLRSAREDVASLPVRRAAPPTVFASQPQPDAPATLSMLRIEPPEVRADPADAPVAVPEDAPSPAPPQPEQQASLSPTSPAADPAPSVPAESIALPETMPAPVIAAPTAASLEVPTDAPATVAAIAPLPAEDQPVSTLTEADTQIAIMNIATLGGPPVDIEPVPLPKSKPAAEPAKKKRAEPATRKKKARADDKPSKRRRLAARAEAPAPVAAPTPVETFGWQQPQR